MAKKPIMNGTTLIKKATKIGNGVGFIINKSYPIKVVRGKYYFIKLREIDVEVDKDVIQEIGKRENSACNN